MGTARPLGQLLHSSRLDEKVPADPLVPGIDLSWVHAELACDLWGTKVWLGCFSVAQASLLAAREAGGWSASAPAPGTIAITSQDVGPRPVV
jgi:hypothetical protein